MTAEFLIGLARTLREVVRPLEEALESPEAFGVLLLEHGWHGGADAELVQAFAERLRFDDLVAVLVDALDEVLGVNGVEVEEAAEVLDAAVELLRALHELTLAAPIAAGPAPLDRPEFWRSFPSDLGQSLLATYLELRRPTLFAALHLGGVVDRVRVPADGTPGRVGYVRTELQWDRVRQAVTDPAALARDVYGWGEGFRHDLLTERLQRGLYALGIPSSRRLAHHPLVESFYAPENPALDSLREVRAPLFIEREIDGAHVEFGIALLPIPPSSEPDAAPVGLLIGLYAEGEVGADIPVGGLFELQLKGGLEADDAFGIELRPGSAVARLNSSSAVLDAGATLTGAPFEPWIVIGQADGTRMEVYDVALGLELRGRAADPELRLRVGTTRLDLVLDLGEGDPIVRELLGEGAHSFTAAGALVWSSVSGLGFEGVGGLAVDIPLNLSFGPVEVSSLSLAIEPHEQSTVLSAAVTASARLGPVVITLRGIGVELQTQLLSEGERPGSFGDLDLSFGFRPPDGAGIVIDAQVAKGGGFLRYDEANSRYGGVFEVIIGNFAVKGFGLLTERADGYSLIVVLSAEFPEPINLVFGLRLAGIGGLLALHHRLDTGALQAGLRTGAASQLLFPHDPVAAAPRILTTLGAVFPPAKGQFLAGPLFKLVWGARSLATLSVALVLEWPDPLRLLILGNLEVTAPHRGFELLLLHAEFAGVIDFERPSFEFDAAISNSRLGPYALSGDIAVRVRGGEEALFLLTAGGFHPQFPVPTNANLPPLRRITVALSSGDNPRARLELYTAITPSTWQIGGKLELSASAAGFTAETLLSVDALFGEIREGDETRCGFVADIEGRAAIRRGGTIIMGVDLQIQLSGTEPWHVKGKAVLHFFFFSVSIPFEGTFGDEPKRPSLPLVDAAAMLRTALEERANWDTALPRGAGPLATLAGRTADADVIVAHPLGRLAVGQHALPFEVEITRVGGARTTPDRFTFPSVRIGTSEAVEPVPLRSPFAAGQFLDLGNDERFTRPAFEPMISGFEVSAAGTTFGAAQVADLHYEEIPIGPDGRLAEPSPGQPPLPTIVAHGALLGAAATSALRRDETATRMRTSATTVQVVNVPPQVVNADTLRPVTVPGLDSAATFTEMAQGLTRHLAGGAAAEQPLAIVGAHEAHDG